jgi:hypothetical protein
MEFTGERFTPEILGAIAAEHYHRYFFASSLVAGKRVLDIASGEGYGTHILAQSAAHVTGVDISPEAVAWAAQKYSGDGIVFLRGDACAIPLPDAAVDVVVSFETLEHLGEQAAMLCEIRRVLRENGLLIISTPNKRLYAAYENAFHVHELNREDFLSLLKGHFTHLTLLGQRVLYGSLLGGAGKDTLLLRSREMGVSAEAVPFPEQALYFIALASNGPLPCADASFFEYPMEKSDLVIQLQSRLAELQDGHDALREIHRVTAEDLRRTTEDLRRATEDLRRAEAAYADILASRSWQVTAPLRRVARFLRGGREER